MCKSAVILSGGLAARRQPSTGELRASATHMTGNSYPADLKRRVNEDR